MGSELTLKINGETYEFTIGRRLGQIPENPRHFWRLCGRGLD